MRTLALSLLLSAAGLAQASEGTETQLYFGDTHLHTTYSFDAFLNKNFTADPAESNLRVLGAPPPLPPISLSLVRPRSSP